MDRIPEPSDAPSLDTFSDGNLHVDFVAGLVIFDVRPASLRNRFVLPAEAAVLACLIEHRNEALTAPQLAELIWGDTEDGPVKRTMAAIARLKMKLDEMDLPRCPVETIPDAGYRYRTLNP